MKGLTEIISVSTTAPDKSYEDEQGRKIWRFEKSSSIPGVVQSCDPVNNFNYVKDIYHKVDPGYQGKFSVPILYDKKTNTIVNNESSQIIQMFNDHF